MAGQPQRIELKIDLLDRTNQRALALPTLTSRDLIAAILQEFDELDYLGKSADDYVLHRAEDNTALDASLPLSQQVGPHTRLVLNDREIPLPSGATSPALPAYLREMKSGNVYKLHWVPAIIGRPDKNRPQNQLLCVNLESHSSGVRVSRRHACITAEQDLFYLEGLSNNPTLLRHDTLTTEVTTERQLLHDGDVIVLGRSDIALKFVLYNRQREK